jgi:hypothetical protein
LNENHANVAGLTYNEPAMTDIVERLRRTLLDRDNFPRMDSEKWLPVRLAKEAADEIERLRALRQTAGCICPPTSEQTCRSIVCPRGGGGLMQNPPWQPARSTGG